MAAPPAEPRSTARSAILPVLTVGVAVGYLGLDLAGAVDETVSRTVPPLAHAGLVVLQAIALLLRDRGPLRVFAAVVALDLGILATSDGQLGIGALAVVVAAYGVVRRSTRRRAYLALGAAVVASTSVGLVAMAGVGTDLLEIVIASTTRLAVLSAAPAAAAEYAKGRARLREVLRERAELLERQRLEDAERELRASRTALARELHDIAGHHLSGIIVSAQAASALTRSDPGRARATLRTLQDDARAALADLRRTVGLLREDGGSGIGSPHTPVPRLEALPALIADARARGQRVEHTVAGAPRTLSPLAENAAYRMIQESLANAARHAPGAPVRVAVEFGLDAVHLAVDNPPVPGTSATATTPSNRYGLSGMAERAALVGGRLSTGPTPGGGWRNQLTLPAGQEHA